MDPRWWLRRSGMPLGRAPSSSGLELLRKGYLGLNGKRAVRRLPVSEQPTAAGICSKVDREHVLYDIVGGRGVALTQSSYRQRNRVVARSELSARQGHANRAPL